MKMWSKYTFTYVSQFRRRESQVPSSALTSRMQQIGSIISEYIRDSFLLRTDSWNMADKVARSIVMICTPSSEFPTCADA